MTSMALAIAFAVFMWWFTTGLVLLLDGLPRTTFRWSHWLSSLLALAAAAGLAHSARLDSETGAYCAFTCALLIWGWHELSFLTGWVTGPRRVAADPGARGWVRFTQAVQAILWHELALLAVGAVVFLLTWDRPNPIGAWTFAVLWTMRLSAKLNLFLGVRNLNLEMLPAPLLYLGSYFRIRRMNLLFPFAVAAATVATVLLVLEALAAPAGSARQVGGLLVATLMGLAIVEHWLLVLPLQASALWRWAMRHHAASAQKRAARQLGRARRAAHAAAGRSHTARTRPSRDDAAPPSSVTDRAEPHDKLLHAR